MATTFPQMWTYSRDVGGRVVKGRWRKGRLVTEDWLKMPIGDGWIAAYRLETVNGRTRVLELRVQPDLEDRRREFGHWSEAVAHADPPIRPFSFERVHRAIRERAYITALEAVRERVARHGTSPLYAGLSGPHQGSEREGRGAGRKAHPRAVYAELAVRFDYEEHVRRYERGHELGESTRQRLATHYGVPVSTIAKRLQTARALGFLTPTDPGQRGSRATAAAQALLKDAARRGA